MEQHGIVRDGRRSRQPDSSAAAWLRETLAGGPVASRAMRELAAAAGYAWRTVERARSRMGDIVIERGTIPGRGARGAWQWRLATPPPAADDGGLEDPPRRHTASEPVDIAAYREQMALADPSVCRRCGAPAQVAWMGRDGRQIPLCLGCEQHELEGGAA